MKKRLLSAALALAMVLTLLPVSAFAATTATVTPGTGWSVLDDLDSTDTASYPVTYHTKDSKDSYGNVFTTAGWYNVNTSTKEIHYAPSGVVTNMSAWTDGTTGTWWSSPDVATQHSNTSFKLIANASIQGHASSKSMWDAVTSLNIDLNGCTLTWSVTDTNKLTSLALSNTATGAGTLSGNISVGTNALGQGKNFTLKLDNVTSSSSLTLNHAGSGSVTVTNSTFGDIDLVGIPAANGTTTTGGSVTVTGSKSRTGHIKLDKMGNGYTISNGSIDVNSGASTGFLVVNSTNNAKIDVTNASSGGITIQGYASTLKVTSGTAGAIKVFGHDSTIASNLKNSTAPTVTITGNGAKVTSIEKESTSVEALLKPYNINVLYNAEVTGTINLDNAEILVNGGKVGGKTALKIGKLTLGAANQATMPTTMAAIELGADTVMYDGVSQAYGEVAMTVAGTNVTTGAITEATKNAMNISVTIPADYNNKFTGVTVTTPDKWAKGTISGGKWTTALKYSDGLLNSNLLYLLTDSRDTGYTNSYWQSKQINELVAKYVDKTTTVKTTDEDSGAGKLTLQVGNPATISKPGDGTSGGTSAAGTPETVFEVSFGPNATTFQLPSTVGANSVKEWTADDRTPVPGGGAVALAGDATVTFTADSLGYQISKVNDVLIGNRQANPTATATFSGNTISLSGAVWAVGNTATIDLVLKTDSKDVPVKVAWNPDTNALTFMESTPTLSSETNGSMIFTDGMTAIQLTVNNTKYTLKNAGLRKEAPVLKVQGNTSTSKGGMTTTVTIAENIMNKTAREQLAKDLTVLAGVDGPVDFSSSPAVLERLGAVLAGIDNNQANAWLKSARQQAYRNQHNNQNATQDAQLLTTGYNTVAAVLYMNVNITSFGNQATGGMLTATMTPYLRVEVQHDDATTWADKNPPIIVRQPASLGRLTGELGQVEISLPTISTGFTPAGYATQNNTYVYPVAQTGGTGAYKFTMTHAASSGDGFGTININGTAAPISMVTDKGVAINPVVGYNTLQAAVDDAKNGYTVKVGPTITGDQTITMTGDARTIYIDTTGNGKVACSSNNVIVTEQVNGHKYAVQLTKSTVVVKPTEGDVTIAVASVTNGRASVSASKAKAGDTITVTSTPNTGYAAGGLTIRTDTGASVSYTTTGTNATTRVATYTFKVPEGAKSITVTPAFAAANTGATVTVSNTSYGTATTSAGSNRVAPGSTVSVTTSPSSGYRTMGLYVTANSGSATAVRTGANSFTFTVPSNATSVVVTPRFDVNNGTLFEDVWSTEYFSSAVAWAVGRGVTNGTSTYTFGSYNSCTRADMVTFLYRAAGSPAVSNVANPFWDVQPGAYYYNAVLWAVSKGITNGVSANQFGVSQYVTRAQAVTFLYRYNGSPAASTYSGFYDVPASEYYAKAVAWAKASGVTDGTSATLFSPSQAVSRAQAVTFLYRNATGVRT